MLGKAFDSYATRKMSPENEEILEVVEEFGEGSPSVLMRETENSHWFGHEAPIVPEDQEKGYTSPSSKLSLANITC